MEVLGRNIFWSFFTELLFVILAIALKEDKRKVVVVLIVGTLIAGTIGFGGALISGLTNISFSFPETSNNSPSSDTRDTTQINNSVTITELKNLTLNDQSYQGNGFLDITLKNNDGTSHSVGIRFWYKEITGSDTEWIVFDRVIENVPGSTSTTSRIVFRPAYDASTKGSDPQAIVTSIDNQAIYSSDDAFNAISVELLSSTHEQKGSFVTLTCTFKVTNKLPVPLSADDDGVYNYSFIENGQEVYESYGGLKFTAPRWDSEKTWGYSEGTTGRSYTIPPSGNTEIVLTMGQSLDRYVLKSMEISEVIIEINDEPIIEWITISHAYKASGCVWISD